MTSSEICFFSAHYFFGLGRKCWRRSSQKYRAIFQTADDFDWIYSFLFHNIFFLTVSIVHFLNKYHSVNQSHSVEEPTINQNPTNQQKSSNKTEMNGGMRNVKIQK